MTRATAAASTRHWADIGESTFVGGIHLLVWVHRWFGRGPFRAILYPVVLYFRSSKPLARRASMQYLQRIEATHGSVGHPPTWRDGVRHFLAFGDTILDKVLAMSGRYRFERMRLVGSDVVREMIAAGQGGVFVTAHMGCLEMCQAAIGSTRRFKLNVLVHTRHAERFNRLLGRLDPDGAVRLIQVTDISPATAVLLAERVARGEFVAIAGDRVPVGGGRTVRLPFLGHAADWPVGAYVLASLLKCPLLLMACLRDGDGQGHAVHLERLAERVELPRAAREAALAEHAGRFVARIESMLAGSPFEWFNFYPFWATHDRA